MGALLLRRLAAGAATLAIVSLVVFGLIRLAPGDAVSLAEGELLQRVPAAEREALRAFYGLDRPPHRHFASWLADALRGDLGRSFHDRRPVTEKIGERLGVSVVLNALALATMVLLAVPIGAAAALRPGGPWDRIAAGGTYALYAIPVFWAALLLQGLFAVELGWLPLAGLRSGDAAALGTPARLADRAAHLVLPVACLSLGGLAYLSRFVRATLLEHVRGPGWRAARARGLSRLAVLYRHGFRRAGLPMLTLAGLLLPGLVGGSVIVESVFAIPGLGDLFVDAALQRDLPVLMGLTLVSGVATLAGIVAADVAYLLADPRLRRAGWRDDDAARG